MYYLLQKEYDLLTELFIHGIIKCDEYFYIEEKMENKREIFTICLN